MADWTDLPWLTADPAVLMAAARTPNPGTDPNIRLLLDDQDFALDADGAEERKRRLVYVVLTKEGADSWGMSGDSWSPWREDRPIVAARVIPPDGAVPPLDGASLVENTLPSADPL